VGIGALGNNRLRTVISNQMAIIAAMAISEQRRGAFDGERPFNIRRDYTAGEAAVKATTL
jgi:hypothetical protein